MILKRQNMSENKWNPFKIVPLITQSLSTVNCQFGEAAKFSIYQPTGRIAGDGFPSPAKPWQHRVTEAPGFPLRGAAL